MEKRVGIYLLRDTKIGVADNVFSEEDLAELFELATWAAANGFKLTDSGGEDFALTEDGHDRPSLDTHYDEWGPRNYTIDLYPSHYIKILDRLSGLVAELFKEYLDLEEVGIGRESPHRDIRFDVIHVIKPPDSINEHIDCFDYGLVFYIGATEDYTGGDLYFTELDITVPMVPNRLLIVPSNLRHRVNPVESGLRVSTTTFVPFGTEFSFEIQNPPRRVQV